MHTLLLENKELNLVVFQSESGEGVFIFSRCCNATPLIFEAETRTYWICTSCTEKINNRGVLPEDWYFSLTGAQKYFDNGIAGTLLKRWLQRWLGDDIEVRVEW